MDTPKKELKMGIKDEREEHGVSKKAAKKLATDHLTKVNKHYYSKLDKVGLEEENINEISKKLMVNYMTKADKEVKGIEKKFKKGTETPDDDKKLTRRVKGMNIAKDKFYKRGKVAASGKDKSYDMAQKILIAKKKKNVSEDYDPIAKKGAEDSKKYLKSLSSHNVGTKSMWKKAIKKYKTKAVTGMDEENINELSKPLLRRYAKKAGWSSMGAKFDDDGAKARKRAKGLKRAGDRLGNTMMVKKKYLAKESKEDTPFDNPTKKKSTPYTNSHSKAKQLARQAMKAAKKKTPDWAQSFDGYSAQGDLDRGENKRIKGRRGGIHEDSLNEISGRLARNYLRKKRERDYDVSADGKTYKTKKSVSLKDANKDAKNTIRALKRIKEENINELHGKGSLEKLTKAYERKADAAKAAGKKILNNKDVGKTMKYSNEVEKWNTNMAKARRGYQLISKRDKESLDEAKKKLPSLPNIDYKMATNIDDAIAYYKAYMAAKKTSAVPKKKKKINEVSERKLDRYMGKVAREGVSKRTKGFTMANKKVMANYDPIVWKVKVPAKQLDEVSYAKARNAKDKAKKLGRYDQADKFKKYAEKKDSLQARYDDSEYKD